MGWASGSILMSDVIEGLLKKEVAEDVRMTVYEVLIPAMQSRDWDTEMECIDEDEAYQKTLQKLHPDWFEASDFDDEDTAEFEPDGFSYEADE